MLKMELLSKIKEKKLVLSLMMLLDFSFIAMLLGFTLPMIKKLFEALLNLTTLIKSFDVPTGTEQTPDPYQAFVANVEFFQYYSEMIRWVFFIAVAGFFIFLIFQGLSYFLAARFYDKKSSWQYLWKFSIISFVAYIGLLIGFYTTVYLSMANTQMIIPVFTQGIINFLLITYFIVLSYFYLVSVSLMRDRKFFRGVIDTFKFGVLKFKRYSIGYLLFMASIAISFAIMFFFLKINIFLFLFGFFILALPLLCLSKIILFYFVE